MAMASLACSDICPVHRRDGKSQRGMRTDEGKEAIGLVNFFGCCFLPRAATQKKSPEVKPRPIDELPNCGSSPRTAATGARDPDAGSGPTALDDLEGFHLERLAIAQDVAISSSSAVTHAERQDAK
jgi:hypothetical protein